MGGRRAKLGLHARSPGRTAVLAGLIIIISNDEWILWKQIRKKAQKLVIMVGGSP